MIINSVMEALIEDIRNQTTAKTISQLEDSIIDCAKNFKSNDATFNISTLPTFGGRLLDLMGDYIAASQRLEACQNAFVIMHEKIEGEDETDMDEYSNCEHYLKLFDTSLNDELKKASPSQASINFLKKIIQVDEEIRVEAPAQTQIPKDPITKLDITCAVRSSVCKHIYDKDSIEQYMIQKQRTKKRIQCPQAGCTNKNMTRDELVLDNETNNLIQSL